MKITCNGIVIWEVKTGESDRIITILTENGLLTGYARSSMKPGSKLTGGTSMLAFSNFELSTGKNMYTVVDATSQNRFPGIYSDTVKYALAIYFCELLRNLAPVEENSIEYLRLILNSLYLLDNDIKPIWQIKTVFEMSIMSISGYMPDVNACSICGRTDSNGSVFFDSQNASWICSDCLSEMNRPSNYNYSVISAVRYIINSEPGKAFAFTLSEVNSKELSRLCEAYVLDHLERKPNTLDFYHLMS